MGNAGNITTSQYGSYVLIACLDSPRTVTVGRLGDIEFARGWYAYTGSAMNSLERRIGRHFSTYKNNHWHIDYFLDYARPVEAVAIVGTRRLECSIASRLSQTYRVVPRFGSSDCRCDSHLFFAGDAAALIDSITTVCAALADSVLSEHIARFFP